MEALHALIQQIRIANGQSALTTITADMRWRENLEFDSFALAELAVYTERDFGVDAFADGVPATVGELSERIRQLQQG